MVSQQQLEEALLRFNEAGATSVQPLTCKEEFHLRLFERCTHIAA